MSLPASAAIAVPRVHLLSNGRYSTLVSDAGSGWSRWCGRTLTRWREDPTRDHWGSYLLLRDSDSGEVWSASRQPALQKPDSLSVELRDGVYACTRRDGSLETKLVVAVAADRDAELRHLTIHNHGRDTRVIEVTSYAEPVLGSPQADAAHPVFSKMFVRTEWVEEGGVLLATRRRQDPREPETWIAQVALAEGQPAHTNEYESDRARFLGRGRTLRSAVAMASADLLSNTAGDVLDPVLSLRRRVRVAPGTRVRIAFWTCVADTREKVLALAAGVDGAESCDHSLAGAATFAATHRARFGLADLPAEQARHLLAALLYSNPTWRAPPEELARGAGGAPVLWAAGISGDRPIALMHVADVAALDAIDGLLRVQRHWQFMGQGVDVVVLNDAAGADAESLHQRLTSLVATQNTALQAAFANTGANVFCLRSDHIDERLRDGLATVARAVLDAAAGPFVARGSAGDPAAIAPLESRRQASTAPASGDEPDRGTSAPEPPEPLQFDNGYGGFSIAADEYVIRLEDGQCTPAPWSNVVANPVFGFIATAEGGGHTFSCNSQQNPLTPWPNDPVSDEPVEVLYLRDIDTRAFWSATALPAGGEASNRITRHGHGWTRYSHTIDGLDVDWLQCVPVADPIKVSRLRIVNRSGHPRRISATAYLQWALGANGTVPGPYVVSRHDPDTGALFATNRWRPEFGERVAFADLGSDTASFTADRGEFLGRYGTLTQPAALQDDTPLSGWTGAGRDPCAALQVPLEIAAHATVELRFLLGDAASADEARQLTHRYRELDIDTVMDEVAVLWDDVLDVVQVHTPDPAMDVLLNQWLLYQTLSCRLWARTAYYQSSGAYGFRDQLQDVMALCVARPDLAREHLLRAASRQFNEGDVQHWWLPPAGQGIRTHISDDRLWLPYVALHYLETSGDSEVLDAAVPFLEGPALKDGQRDAFFTPGVSDSPASLYEHCARALDASLELGVHQLPLIGTGDWNDGMNRVGEQGKGESVWLAWLLLDSIARFTPIARQRGDDNRVTRWTGIVAKVKPALESAGWDGAWYRRGYYDDGTPLGSSISTECRIDSIAQSWAVMSAAADPLRARRAMASMDEQLVDRRHRLARLFTPPFEHSQHDPGYIKAYPPGVRENGGQYTHGATWSIFAWAGLKDGDRAWELFDLLNPIRHSDTRLAADHFKVEPYVSCADVYSVGDLAGRGGWTWYTGSAGWLYRAGIEAVLGFRLRGTELWMDPCIPQKWPGFELVFRYRGSRYRLEVINPAQTGQGVVGVEIDSVVLATDSDFAQGARIPLIDDGREHHVLITLGSR